MKSLSVLTLMHVITRKLRALQELCKQAVKKKKKKGFVEFS